MAGAEVASPVPDNRSINEDRIMSHAPSPAPGTPTQPQHSATSGPKMHSGRKRQSLRAPSVIDNKSETGRSRDRTPSGLVTDVNLGRSKSNTEDETKKKRNRRKSSKKPNELLLAEVDIESSDLETELGEDLGFQQAVFHDVDVMSRHIYERKCDQLGVVPISMVLRKISATELNLRNHQCGPVGARAIAVPLVYNKSITVLDLSSNGIGDSGIRPICDCLMENVAVKDLRLAGNMITIAGLKHISRLVLNNRNIRDLDIAGNHLGDSSAKILEYLIKETRNLKTLHLGDNNLGISSGIHLGNALANNESLEELNLSWNHIRLDGATSLAEGLKENITLHSLDLSWNGFGQETADCLGKLLTDNEGLRSLNLAGNRLTDEAMVKLARGLQANEKLERIVLNNNLITNVGAFALLVGVKKNENSVLQHIDIKDVTVQDDSLVLLSEIQEHQDLQFIYNIYSLRPLILNPMDVLLSYIMDRGLEGAAMFNLIKVDSADRPQHTETRDFTDTLKKAGVPLTYNQLLQLANSLVDQETGLVDVGSILDALTDLQADTASAITSGSLDALSDVMDTVSMAPSSTTIQDQPEDQPEDHSQDHPSMVVQESTEAGKGSEDGNKIKGKKERESIQAGQQYSW